MSVQAPDNPYPRTRPSSPSDMTRKGRLRRLEEIDVELSFEARLRGLGKIRGEDRSTKVHDQSRLDKLLAERFYVMGE